MTISGVCNRYGWTKLDWEIVEVCSTSLSEAAIDLDRRVCRGAGESSPEDLLDLADRVEAAAKRLRELAKNHF